MKKKIIYIALTLLAIVVLIAAYIFYSVNKEFNIDKTVYVYIDESKDYDNLLLQLRDSAKINNLPAIELLASVSGYKNNIRAGRYAVSPDMTALQLIRNLRNGHQSPVKLKFNNIRTKDDFARRIAAQLICSEETILHALNDANTCEAIGFNTETILAMFIPNTYEVYWDINLDNFLQRMKREYNSFWTDKRLLLAKEVGLSPVEVSILASIVEEECMYQDEYPMVAGLYLNRLRAGQALQADPTVKFAVGDFSLRRILNKHLSVASPYNTYLHTGLPPGPIRIPSIKGIDAVLNYTKSNYYYMCAKEDFSGRHNFANTYAEHQLNAAKYRKALNERGIY